jgi:hypothetical protein
VAAGRNLTGLLSRLGLALAAAAIVLAATRAAWQRPLKGLSPAQAAFARVVRVAGWLGLRLRRQDTPYEFASRLAGAMPEADAHVTAITGAYVQERFARSPEAADPSRLTEAWNALRRSLAAFGTRRAARRLARRP